MKRQWSEMRALDTSDSYTVLRCNMSVEGRLQRDGAWVGGALAEVRGAQHGVGCGRACPVQRSLAAPLAGCVPCPARQPAQLLAGGPHPVAATCNQHRQQQRLCQQGAPPHLPSNCMVR